MSDTSEEKEFEPTPQKLLEARRKGEIAKSADLNTSAAYLGFLVSLFFVGGGAVDGDCGYLFNGINNPSWYGSPNKF